MAASMYMPRRSSLILLLRRRIVQTADQRAHVATVQQYGGGHAAWKRANRSNEGNRGREALEPDLVRSRKIAAEERTALTNYENFHSMSPGTATIRMVTESSAGIAGWMQNGRCVASEASAKKVVASKFAVVPD
jgi:hypothetical protein